MGEIEMQGSLIMAPTVEHLSRAVARRWCSTWHYTGKAAGARFLGWSNGGELQAIVGIGSGGNPWGVASKFGLEEFRCGGEITRVVVSPDAAFNTASRALQAVLDYEAGLGLEWFVSYSDTAQGHHGGIYQALNAVYVGTTARQWVNFALDGKRVSKREISAKFGTTRWPEVRDAAAAHGMRLERVGWMPKLTYILVVAKDRRRRRAIRESLRGFALPYPKRDEALTSLATPYRNHRPLRDACPKCGNEDWIWTNALGQRYENGQAICGHCATYRIPRNRERESDG